MLLLCTFYIFLIGIQPLALLSVLWCSLAQQMSKTKLSSYFHIHMSDILAKKIQRNNSNIKMPFCHPPSKKESTCQDVLLLESLMLMWPSHVLSDASDSDAALCYCFIGFHCSVPDTQTQTGHFLWAEASRSDFVIHLIISAERYNLIRKTCVYLSNLFPTLWIRYFCLSTFYVLLKPL